ncbi:MAG: PTS sugar transporter [Acidithiobacillus ferrivorans]|uniref:PTS sugar transporter n=1 Tax=Acidithiobacillus ferrivorans TaxID=160808 RepID=A0A257TBB0_9PROT|nr:MAG: PTS sugar transporter [Acidithiobacillus ferrivorans]
MVTLPLSPANIRINPPVADAGDVLRTLAEILAGSTGLSAKGIAVALQQREIQGSTGIGHGVALPHARVEGVNQIAIAALRTAQGIPFAAPDGLDVSIFLAVVVPKAAATAHLETLSALAAKLAVDEVREALMKTPDPQDFFRLLAGPT